MNLSRVSKKVPHVDHRQTLPSLHKKKLDEFSAQRKTLPDKERLLGQLITQYNSDDCVADRYELYKRVNDMQDEVKKLRDNFYEIEYLIHAAPYLKEYYTEIEKTKKKQLNVESKLNGELDRMVESSKVVNNKFGFNVKNNNDLTKFIMKDETTNKGKIYREFSAKCLSGNYSSQLPKKDKPECEKLICECGGERTIISREAIASCTTCGNTTNYVDDSGPVEYRPEVEMLSQFALIILALKSMMRGTPRHCPTNFINSSGPVLQTNTALLSY